MLAKSGTHYPIVVSNQQTCKSSNYIYFLTHLRFSVYKIANFAEMSDRFENETTYVIHYIINSVSRARIGLNWSFEVGLNFFREYVCSSGIGIKKTENTRLK